jgi:hypothetical protein
MHKLCVGNGTTFWRRAQQVIRLCQPVMDAIHQLEGDKPLASQVYPVWNALEDHFQQWHNACPDQSLKADMVSLGGGLGARAGQEPGAARGWRPGGGGGSSAGGSSNDSSSSGSSSGSSSKSSSSSSTIPHPSIALNPSRRCWTS